MLIEKLGLCLIFIFGFFPLFLDLFIRFVIDLGVIQIVVADADHVFGLSHVVLVFLFFQLVNATRGLRGINVQIREVRSAIFPVFVLVLNLGFEANLDEFGAAIGGSRDFLLL